MWSKVFFSKYDPFESRQFIRRDLQRSHTNAHSVTHFHTDINCHVNLIDPTTPFGTQNESHHFE
jgi:hypothetical protein